MPVIPAVGMLRLISEARVQGQPHTYGKLQACQGYILRFCLKTKSKQEGESLKAKSIVFPLKSLLRKNSPVLGTTGKARPCDILSQVRCWKV